MTVYGNLRRVFNSVYGFKCGYVSAIRASAQKASFSVQSRKDETNPVVTHEQLKLMLANNSIQLFDVRNPDEFQAGQIPGSVNVPLEQLEESLKLPPDSFKKLFKVRAPQKEDDNIVFHCQRGRRSLIALDIACHLGFSRARHYAGGYSEWAEKEKQ